MIASAPRITVTLVLLILSTAISVCAQSSGSTDQTQDPAKSQSASASSQPESTGTSADPTTTSTPESRWRWSFSIRNRTGFRVDEPRVLQMSRTLLEARGICKLNEHWKLTLDARAHIDPVKRLGYPSKGWSQVWVDPREVLLDGKVGRVDLRLGLQQIVWGQADGLRVLDVINPLDYREFILEDFLDSRRPLWAVRADMPLGKGSVQFVVIPYFAPGRLAPEGAEYGIGPRGAQSLINAAYVEGGAVLPPVSVQSDPIRRPAYQPRSSQAGVRYSHSVGSWDLTANYFYGWEDTPTWYSRQPDVQSIGLLPLVQLAPRYDRREVIGGTATNNFGPVVARFEAGWNRNKAVAVKSGSVSGLEKAGQFSGVAGLDYSPREWLAISGQYFLSFTSAPQKNLLFPRYSNLVSLLLRTNFRRDTIRPEIFILKGLNRGEYMVRPRLTKVINDQWTVSAGADFLGGRASTIFGYFGTRDRAIIEIKWAR